MAAIKAENRTLDHYFKSHIKSLDRTASKRNFSSIYKTKVLPIIPPDTKIKDVKSSDIDDIIRAAEGVCKIGSVQAIVKILSAVFNRCVKNKVIKSSPLRKRHYDLKADKLEQKTIVFDSLRMYKAIKSTVKSGTLDPQEEVLVLFLLHGRRINEICTLEWRDIDHDQCTYVIRPENSKVRVFMSFAMKKRLSKALKRLREFYIWSPEDNERIFYSTKGKSEGLPLTTISHIWKRVRRGKIYEHIRPHDFRRIVATRMKNKGSSKQDIETILGHLSDQEEKQYSELDRVSRTKKILKSL